MKNRLAPAGQCMAKDQYISQLRETFATSVPSRIAAFFAEPIQVSRTKKTQKQSEFKVPVSDTCCTCVQGVGGAVQYPKNYLKEAFELVRERGGLCIADEVSAPF